MSIDYINAEDILKLTDSSPILDVRSPLEYLNGHIPGALNFPLFTNEERAEVGTLYKKKGSRVAIIKGLEFVGPKLSAFVQQADSLNTNGTLALYCWRGGKRSASMAWLLSNAGFNIKVITGGYKAYRSLVHKLFEQPDWKLIVLGGKTGSMKSKVLREMSTFSEQIIDLEKLANHKGSAFGWIDEDAQPSTEQFENLLFSELVKFKTSEPVWCENESKTIGKVYIPNSFWNHMQNGILFHIDVDFNIRIRHILSTYNLDNHADLIFSFEKIRKRLGHQATDLAIHFIKSNQIKDAAAVALEYYDKFYDYGLGRKNPSRVLKFNFDHDNVIEICESLIQEKNKINFNEYYSVNSI
ncbi:MAG: tRNA 2-selenouridine(34) synthase MnmH [Saprospiraceae bacterium]|nr:tRNA 2-selenouridine(34) synthase MnmH [Candidatus Vicinibacter affinis]MBP6172255.1 tRNA 2-selenouridine(34) synthase MnmH [Saprospiraceae bacterium]MBK7799430.1 tRNA 2-selenouridine(34) synthase MnmH [Candidatus Vicinibacter affinis]MBK8642928.1 tRNA 2-selenouridine(34) synthase MnmH [Candidatus Vicinibacter affinis]MBK9643083.1 tRNA 2-selenouridine(34) synthase MnmH [Candidatus Vicinibacter affinis]